MNEQADEPDHDDLDVLELYRWAVQDPETHATVLQIMYERLRPGRTPLALREDFAGTSAESVAWVALGEGRRALAVDLAGETLGWAQRRAQRLLGAEAAQVEFVTADVMDVAPPQVAEVDIISVLNFSICYFQERAALLRYCRHALTCLAPDGVMVLNVLGGREVMKRRTDRRRVIPTPRLESEAAIAPFDYEWEHRSFDAVSGILDCRIHFGLPDVRRDAFCYRFRLWGLAELSEVLREAGFAQVEVWRHTYDAAKGDDGVFLGRVDAIEDVDDWIAYVVAAR